MSKAEKILSKCERILDNYDADYRGGYVTNINGTDYIVFKYYGGTNDTVDRNDDSWDEIYDLDGVCDVGYGDGYGEQMKGTNFYKNSDCLVIELEDGLNESKKSATKSIKEERFPKLNEFKKFCEIDDRIIRCEWEELGEYTIYCEKDTDIEELAEYMSEEFDGIYHLNNDGSLPSYNKKYPHFEFLFRFHESKRSATKSLKESNYDLINEDLLAMLRGSCKQLEQSIYSYIGSYSDRSLKELSRKLDEVLDLGEKVLYQINKA